MKKLVIPSDALKAALKKVSLAVPKKSVLPVLSNLYVRARPGEADLIGTDLELTISYTCTCECKQAFEFLLPFEFLSKLTPMLGSQPVTFELQGKKVIVTADGELYQLTTEKTDDYPKIPDVPKKNTLELTGDFMTWLERSMATTGKDESRKAMTHSCLELQPDGITIVSTDAHTLFKHFFPMQVPTTETILISAKIGVALQEFEKSTIFWHSHHVAFRADNITVISTRHNDKYPDWKVVIPQTRPNLKLYRHDLLTAVNKSLLIDDRQLRLQFEPPASRNGKFSVAARNDDYERNSSLQVTGEYSGSTLEILFGPVYMRTMLMQIPFDEIRLNIDAPTRGVLITSEEDENYLGLIMPLHN